MIPASVVALAGGAPPRLMYSSLPGHPFRGDPGGRAAKEATRVSTPRKIPYEDAKSSGYQQRSAERVAPLAPAPCRPGVLPGPLPKSGLISETASRLDAFSGYPCRA